MVQDSAQPVMPAKAAGMPIDHAPPMMKRKNGLVQLSGHTPRCNSHVGTTMQKRAIATKKMRNAKGTGITIRSRLSPFSSRTVPLGGEIVAFVTV